MKKLVFSNLGVILERLNFSPYKNILIRGNKISILEICHKQWKIDFEKNLSELLGETLKLNTNKQKPLKVVLEIFKEDIFLKIFQKNSRGNLVVVKGNIYELPTELFSIVSPIQNRIILEEKIVKIENAFNVRINNFLHLNEEDLVILLGRKVLTSFEKKQVLYSYKFDIAFNYDFHPEMIDDGEQYRKAIENNKKLEPLKALYEKLFIKHNIDKKGEVGKYL